MYLNTNTPQKMKLIKKVINDISISKLDDYIKASIKETIQRLKYFVG